MLMTSIDLTQWIGASRLSKLARSASRCVSGLASRRTARRGRFERGSHFADIVSWSAEVLEQRSLLAGAPTSVIVDNLGNLVISDVVDGGKDDHWQLSRQSSNVVLTDLSGNTIDVSSITGASGNGTSIVKIPLSKFTNQILLNTQAGDDTVVIDFSGGNIIKSAGLTFDGGESGDLGDALFYQQNGLVTVTDTRTGSGSINTPKMPLVKFMNLEDVETAQPRNVSINDISHAEGQSESTPFTFTVQLSNAQVAPIDVVFSTSDGTATKANDYTAVQRGTVTIPAGQTSATLTVSVMGDIIVEKSETFFVHLLSATGPGGIGIARSVGRGTILNDESVLVTAAGPGGGPHVSTFSTNGQAGLLSSFFAFDSAFTGGVRVATADFNNDGVSDIVAAAGPGGGPHVKVIDGLTGAILRDFFAYSPTFTGGVFVAAGDINGDGTPDIITGSGAGGGPHVKVFDGITGAVTKSFFAYGSTFTGGVRVATGDVNGDGRVDIITGSGSGGGPHVKVFNGKNLALMQSFFAFDAQFQGGVYVAAGDVNGDGKADIIVGAGQGGGPQVKVFSGLDQSLLFSFFAYAPTFTGGVTVAAADLNGDGKADIVTGAASAGPPHVKVFSGADLTELSSFFAFDANFSGGVFVAAR